MFCVHLKIVGRKSRQTYFVCSFFLSFQHLDIGHIINSIVGLWNLPEYRTRHIY